MAQIRVNALGRELVLALFYFGREPKPKPKPEPPAPEVDEPEAPPSAPARFTLMGFSLPSVEVEPEEGWPDEDDPE